MDLNTLYRQIHCWRLLEGYLTSDFIPMHFAQIYRVTRKGWDCKDDLKLFNYDDPRL